MKYRLFLALVLSGWLVGLSLAQDQPELDRLEEKVSHHLETKMPGWKYKRGEPIQGSKGVLIGFWSLPNRGVKISISTLASPEKAQESLQSFVKHTTEAKPVKGFGDEAYVWGFEESDIVFRRGGFVVYVNAGASVDDDPDARTLSQSEKRAREYSEIKRLSKEFAKHVASAVDLP